MNSNHNALSQNCSVRTRRVYSNNSPFTHCTITRVDEIFANLDVSVVVLQVQKKGRLSSCFHSSFSCIYIIGTLVVYSTSRKTLLCKPSIAIYPLRQSFAYDFNVLAVHICFLVSLTIFYVLLCLFHFVLGIMFRFVTLLALLSAACAFAPMGRVASSSMKMAFAQGLPGNDGYVEFM